MSQPIPYTGAALRQDLGRLEAAWEDCQATRNRDAIYDYLQAVFDLVAWWTADGQDGHRACRALRLCGLKISGRYEPFAAVIRCTADAEKVDKRTISKWSRLMRYAAAYKDRSEPLRQFVRRKGGINACAARFGRMMRRSGACR